MAESQTKEKAPELKDDNGKPIMEVKIYSAFNSYFEGMAYSISAVNHTGPFDILPRHHNFMTLIKACDIQIKSPEGDKKIPVTQALMHIKSDKVVVFVDS